MIKLVVFDFDGVFTDGMFNFDNNNNVNKSYNAKDAYSLNILKQNNIKCGIITNDKIVSIKHAPHIFDRLDKVSIGSEKPKLDIITEWIKEYNLSYKEVAYIGDDLPDIPILENVGFSGCPNDAIEDVKNISNYICKNDGGKGGVREFVDLIIKNNIKYTKPKTQSYKYLITGGYGFLGINFINYLIENGTSADEIVVIDNLSSSNTFIDKYSFMKGISLIEGDIGNDILMNNLNFNVDVIFHFAAQSGGQGSFDDTVYDSNTNAKGTLLLLNFARRVHCTKIIFTSTCAVYGGMNTDAKSYNEDSEIDTNTFYAINKHTSEKYLKLYEKNYGINYTIFRLFNCYGPYQNLMNMKQGMVSIFMKQILSNDYPEIIVKGSLERVRDFVYVKDVVKILYDSIINPKFENELFNLGSGIPTNVGNLLTKLIENTKKKRIVVKGETSGDMGKLYADNSKLQNIYDNKFIFTPLDVGIKEFCEHYFINTTETKNDGKITAIIPVRKGSQRCKNKNIRNFGDTNLLKLKIKSLKQVKGIEEIIVSTDCDDMISIAEELNVKVHKRDEYYASSECPNYKYWTYLAENVGYCSNIMMVNVVSPLIDSNIINNFIDKFVQLKYTNMVTVNEQKSFFCNSLTTNGINFDSTKAPNSQELIPLSEITFGICIATKKQIINSRCIYGEKPVFFNVDSISGIDIDENSDFIKAELLYNENILNENTCKMILEKRSDKIELLDCTIRDGGYLNNWEFTDEEVLDCYKAASEAGYDYFEIGFRTNKKLLLNKGKWCYCIEDDINNIYQQYQGCKIVVMAKMDTVTIDDFVKKSESNISMVRVLLARVTNENGVKICKYNKNDLERTKNFCQELINYGYEVCVNFGCGDIIDECEITLIAHTFYDVNIKALYLADTYGGFNTNNIPKQLHRFYHEFDKYKSNISIGFHCHNNNGDALDKTKKAIFHGCNIIDSCIGGLGRGAGNLKSEELMSYLYTDKTKYIHKIYPLIVYFDKHILSKKEYNIKQMNHPYYKISGYISLHPDYISDILLNHNSSVEEDINLIVKLDEYTKQTNKRNYNKELICVL
uniref:N-acylneuraminate cytidylyltransferase n=1 Tax=viral metagenome TaxID=1070528 RepID=A0A6C0CNS6_9ZZZZ